MAMPSDNALLIRRYFEDFWDQRNFDLAGEIFATTFVFHAPIVPAGIHGADEYRQRVVTPLLTAFPDLKFTLGEAIIEEDRVAMQFTMNGTHQGPFEGIPPTGKRFAVPGMIMARVAAGKIEELRGVFDGVGMMQQLGVLPAPS
jgi:steroid delta-isomerase-like uncharacterized protein